MLDRLIPPKSKLNDDFFYLKAHELTLNNGLSLYSINHGKSNMIKIEWVFDAGTKFQDKPLQASACLQMLLEGTKTKNAEAIANIIDGWGIFTDTSCLPDTASLSVYCLKDKVKKILPIIRELFTESIFPEEEINHWLVQKKQNFLYQMEKGSYQSKRAFDEQLFPSDHPYNSRVELEDFDNLSREDLLVFYQEHYLNAPMRIYVSGNIGEEVGKLLNIYFGKPQFEKRAFAKFEELIDSPLMSSHITMPNAVQTALRVGKRCIGRDHEDYHRLFICNTLLGGFFGSRLMGNIREDKGYTYGIGSGIVSYNDAAYFFISTEVGTAFKEDTIFQIELELKKMAEEEISEDEVFLLKNYIKGSLMRNFDGAFAAMDRFKAIHEAGLTYDFYEKMFTSLKNLNSNQMNEVSSQYLNFTDMFIISAGN